MLLLCWTDHFPIVLHAGDDPTVGYRLVSSFLESARVPLAVERSIALHGQKTGPHAPYQPQADARSSSAAM
jgi:hypothetical protein